MKNSNANHLAIVAAAFLGVAGCYQRHIATSRSEAITPQASMAVAASPTTEPIVITTPSTEPIVTTAPVAQSIIVSTPSTQPIVAITPVAAPIVVRAPDTKPIIVAAPTVQPVATSDLGKVAPITGLGKKPKPFIALPKAIQMMGGVPSTLLQEHASNDSPVPLSDYGKQPTYTVADFDLRSTLSAADVEQRLGPPAQWADNEDPWFVYRLTFNRELWLHFAGPDRLNLLAADVVRGAEDGYVRTRVFDATAPH